jgi:uncharacterized repeat protein (TIGR01451 family)
MLLGVWPYTTKATSSTIAPITSTTARFNDNPSISGDGTRIAFDSTADLTGGNPDGSREIFVYDTATGFTQVTNSTGFLSLSVNASISGNGTCVAFVSFADLTGGNADHGEEIFLFNAVTSNITQITTGNSDSEASRSPSISADGTRIAFHSFADLTGANADHSGEIFLFDTAAAGLTQITNSTDGHCYDAAISGDGKRIAFQSDANLTGGNADRNQEIFLYDTVTSNFTQITDSAASSNDSPSINDDGTRIAFDSNADLTGGNADGKREIFLFDSTTGDLKQLTNSTEGGSGTASISGDGTRIAFPSTSNLTGGNPNFDLEMFLFDTGDSSITQLTNSSGEYRSPAISADGTQVAFTSTANLNGTNADQNKEVFLATCSMPPSERPADLLVSKSATPDPVKTGDNLTYTIRVRNLGPGPAINLVLNDPLPLGTTFVSGSSTHGSLISPPPGAVGTVTCDAARVAIGDTLTVTLVVNVTARGKTTITNEASAGADPPDPNSSNNQASVQTRVFGARR